MQFGAPTVEDMTKLENEKREIQNRLEEAETTIADLKSQVQNPKFSFQIWNRLYPHKMQRQTTSPKQNFNTSL